MKAELATLKEKYNSLEIENEGLNSGLGDKSALQDQIDEMNLAHLKEVDRLKTEMLAMKRKQALDLEKVQDRLRDEIRKNRDNQKGSGA